MTFAAKIEKDGSGDWVCNASLDGANYFPLAGSRSRSQSGCLFALARAADLMSEGALASIARDDFNLPIIVIGR